MAENEVLARRTELEMATMLARREVFLSTRYPHLNTDRNGCATLRKEASGLGLAVSRSTKQRICFYLRGTDKVGNTFVNFSRTQAHSLLWMLTGDVSEVLNRWQKMDRIKPASAATPPPKTKGTGIQGQLCLVLWVQLATFYGLVF
jgi:hypothetical protein